MGGVVVPFVDPVVVPLDAGGGTEAAQVLTQERGAVSGFVSSWKMTSISGNVTPA